jgi:F1F0 ATPase subunit 2
MSTVGPLGLAASSSIFGSLAAALMLGIVLGGVCFGGLWWTVRRGLASGSPALWFGLSALGRMAVVLVGFYFIAQGGVSTRVLACLLGLVVARITVTRLTRQVS